MFDKIIYTGLHFIMKHAGTLNAWAWRKHTKILRNKQRIENEEYVKELQKKQAMKRGGKPVAMKRGGKPKKQIKKKNKKK